MTLTPNKILTTEKRAAANIGLPQWGLTCFYYSAVLNRSAVLRLNFYAENPPLRQAETVCDLNQLLMKQVIECYLTDGIN
jgi:hypothetical protein